MDSRKAVCPDWLAGRLLKLGGSTSFHEYMRLSLNDSVHGAYATGRLRIGKQGDFTTSPSIGPDFANLLAIQVADWLKQLDCKIATDQPLYLIEVGPGEGDLIIDLISELEVISPQIFSRLEIILVESSKAMVERQKIRIGSISNIPIHWKTLGEMARAPVFGVMIANEILDALPVERLILSNNKLLRQGVNLFKEDNKYFLSFCELPLSDGLKSSLNMAENHLGLHLPPSHSLDGWCSEWHVELNEWFKQASAAIVAGPLLIIDYALSANSYYSPSRSSGTLMAYRNQIASSEILKEAGLWDLTSHLCKETVTLNAVRNGWNTLGHVLQGQALLALGLAERLYSLQSLPSSKLDVALQRREALLRLVDPIALGNFFWLAFEKNADLFFKNNSLGLRTLFLETPTN